ncbi:hypothetical protein J2I47_18875 [Fibrella sp. HMF5335]|uniref:Uncharacterized protein n=1 Tax=Fibrella rubiginis TaxID=2817060 RepID=A0A939GIV4_9BACT|nr:hypothetical protein [Fibrella rubiginis]MBO0938623.1 hypothetical protein [Fibrella rubiginis]
MKTCMLYLANILLCFALFTNAPAQSTSAQPGQPNQPAEIPPPLPASAERVSFSLKNTTGRHCMFRAYGPGIAYGFTMNRNEAVPKNWPVGTKLYFSSDGETNDSYILTVTANDAGKTVYTERVKPVNPNMVSFRLRNNSLLPRKVALISYEPNQTGNSTHIFMMGPYGYSGQNFPTGTKLYLADNAQVDIVMSGKRLDNGKPFLTVTKEDAGKTFNIAD